MSKNIKGKNIDINLNITQAGTFNADIFNAYSDFTLNGSSIVSRIATNEADIIVLETTKQDNLVIQQTISASSTAIASSDAIIAYVSGSTPSISATFPLNYVAGVISGTFNSVASAGSNAFLSSGTIYNALQGKQDSLVIQQSISPSATQICSADAILAYVNLSNVVGATAPLNYVNRIISGTFDSVPTSSSNNFVSSGSLFSKFALYQPLITQFTVITCADIFSGSLTLTAGISSVLGISTTNGTIESTNGIVQAQTIRQAGVNLLNEINTKQDILTIQQTISASSTAIASSNAIIAYVAGSTPSISATYPLQYTAGVISGDFNSVASAGSNAFLSSGVIYNALASKQDSLVIQSSVSPSATQICSADAIIQYVTTNLTSKQDTITASTNIDCGSIACFNDIDIDSGNLNVFAGTINGNLYPSLSAGNGIQILQNTPSAGLTQIVNTGSLTTSTQYAFQATSNVNNNQTISAGVRLSFNVVEIDTQAGFSTGQYIYTVPAGAGGVWTFGFKAFINTSPTSFRLGIYKNGGLIGMGGYSTEATEAFDVVCSANAGDYFMIQGVSGGASVYMSANHSWFYGYRLESVNNTVSSTTSLTTADLTTNGDINIQGFNLRNTNSALLLNGTTARIDCDSIVIQNQIASSGSIVATTQITSSGGDIVATTGDIIGVNVLAGTTNLLTEINTKQETLSAGSGIVLTPNTPSAGITEIKTTEITPLSRIYERNKNNQDAPTGQNCHTDFNVLVQNSIYCSYVTPNINTGGTGTGIIINVAGNYKLDYKFNCFNSTYNNRVCWWSRPVVNGTALSNKSFIYTRGNNAQYGQYGSSSNSFTINLQVGDYIHLFTKVAKNSPAFNNDWSGLRGDNDSMMRLTYLD